MTNKKYFEIIAEIDYLYFVLEQMMSGAKRGLSPIEIMVDEATGYSKQKIKEAKKIIKRIKVLQNKLPKNDPHFLR